MNIRFDETGFGEGGRRVRWDEIVAVGVRTSPDGPWLEDVFWQFMTAGGIVELPGTLVDRAALDVMQKQLPGIDNRKIAFAMGSTSDRTWRIWHFEESQSQWDDGRFAARFTALVGRLGGVMSRANEAFLRLRAAWSAHGRRYHNLEHLAECLRELDGARAEPSVADIAELALWYHDAVYEPFARDNEERSAALLCHDAAMLGLRQEHVSAAAQCVRATAHLAGRTLSSPAADLVVDADLAILGRDPLRFMDFEYSVAEEYAGIADTTYLLARGRFLVGLVGLPSIFRTKHFGDRYEVSARTNIAALLRSPRYRAHRWFGGIYRWFHVEQRCPFL